jgi:glycosyltransferase involved in cell wall biosynthesis
MHIALVTPSAVGGVATTQNKLYRGLVGEGFHVDLIKLRSLPYAVVDDFLNGKRLAEYDLVLYTGSIPWPGHILAKLTGTPTALFIHGFLYHELSHVLLHGESLRGRLVAAAFITLFQASKYFNTVDLYICRSLTTCENNKISKEFVLLPHWVFPEEVRISIRRTSDNDIIRVVTYMSYAESPRLLNTSDFVALAQAVRRVTSRRVEFIVISPRGGSAPDPVRIVKPMPREKFLALLESAHLYVERCIDEELGHVSLEALAVGTPVAKLTHRRYWDRQDYGEEDLIVAPTFRGLIERIAEYINNVDSYYDYYSRRGREFVLNKRVWSAVRGPFLAALRRVEDEVPF